MISFIGFTEGNKLEHHDSINLLDFKKYERFWVDFNNPTNEEIKHLSETFQFHPLAIEDCTNHVIQRPKLDYYEDHTFFITHSVRESGNELFKGELDFFVADNFIVTFHLSQSEEVSEVLDRTMSLKNPDKFGSAHIFYEILDKIVDNYFPILYKIEDKLDEIDENPNKRPMNALLDELFDTRSMLLNLMHTINPMRDLLYRLLNSHRLSNIIKRKEYFSDIYDHLLKLADMVMSNREITADIRDNYISLNSNQTNNVMKFLTIMTTMFSPMALISGIFGMNFKYMSILNWRVGFPLSLALMGAIGLALYWWFKKKGWF